MPLEQIYKQATDSRWSGSVLTDGGVCYALCLHWASLKIEYGSDSMKFWYWLGVEPNVKDPDSLKIVCSQKDSDKLKNEMLNLMTQQNVLRKLADTKGIRISVELEKHADSFMLEHCRAKKCHPLQTIDKPSKPQMFDYMTCKYSDNGKNFAAIVYLTSVKRDNAHVMGISYEGGGTINLFDPDVGEFSYNTRYGDRGFVTDNIAGKLLDRHQNIGEFNVQTFSL